MTHDLKLGGILSKFKIGREQYFSECSNVFRCVSGYG